MKSLDAKLASIPLHRAARPTSSSPTPRTPTWPRASRRPAPIRSPAGRDRGPTTGPEVMQELVAYDPHLVVGILGGSAGTTYDAFFLLEDARRHGARAALFGRKINNSEHQLTFVRHLRAIADGQVDAAGACRAYHEDLAKLGITPHRPCPRTSS